MDQQTATIPKRVKIHFSDTRMPMNQQCIAALEGRVGYLVDQVNGIGTIELIDTCTACGHSCQNTRLFSRYYTFLC